MIDIPLAGGLLAGAGTIIATSYYFIKRESSRVAEAEVEKVTAGMKERLLEAEECCAKGRRRVDQIISIIVRHGRDELRVRASDLITEWAEEDRE